MLLYANGPLSVLVAALCAAALIVDVSFGILCAPRRRWVWLATHTALGVLLGIGLLSVFDLEPAVLVGGLKVSLVVGVVAGLGSLYLRSKRERLIAYFSVEFVAATIAMFVLLSPRVMWDTAEQISASPDGKNVAVLYYNDGPTFGFYHIAIRKAGWRLLSKPEDVAEVDSEGLESVRWDGPNRLIVTFDGTPYDHSEDRTGFVVQRFQWRNVQIAYLKSIHKQ